MTDKLLKSTPAPGVLLLTLNRPECLNAFDQELSTLLDNALAAAATDDEIRCIVLTGTGRAFSAGFDVRELAGTDDASFLGDDVKRYEWMWNVAEHPKPVIVANPGIAMGAGAIIAVSADLRVGTEESIIRFSSTPYGTAMLTWNLPQLVGWSKAKEYLMTSCKIDSQEALRSGLLNRVTSGDKLLETAIEMAAGIASFPGSGPQNIKRLMREGLTLDQRTRMEREMIVTQKQVLAGGNRAGEFFSHLINKPEQK